MMSKRLARAAATLIASAIIFTAWAMVDLILMYHWWSAQEAPPLQMPEYLLRYRSRVEIHSLRFTPGLDLLVLPAAAVFVYIGGRFFRRAYSVAAISAATVFATILSMMVNYYPALILSGRVSSPFPFVGVSRGLREAAAVAVIELVVTLVAAWLLVGLARLARENQSGQTREMKNS